MVVEDALADAWQAIPSERLSMLMTDALWAPLRAAIQDITTVHLVTHDVLHCLPIEQGRPEAWEAFTYPGLLFFCQRHYLPDVDCARPACPSTENATLALHIDAAMGTDAEIPFVAADARFAVQVWGAGVHVTEGAATIELWQPNAAVTLPLWYFACHGDDHTGSSRQTFLYLDAASDRVLDAATVLQAAQRPRVLILGACVVGRIREDVDGEPLGLSSVFFLRGADFIVAPLQAVSDFYMPLLVGLFHQAWQEFRDPRAALAAAKRRLRDGDWYETTAAHVRSSYLPVMGEILRRAHTDAGVARSVAGWLLPEPIHGRYAAAFDVRQDVPTLRAFQRSCATEKARTELAGASVERLIAERDRLPAAPIEHLCIWVRGFGRPRPLADACRPVGG